jgi:hypothetical protein
MSRLTIRLTAAEMGELTNRAKVSGLSIQTFVRNLILEAPPVTAADLLKQMKPLMGERKLRVRRLG